jgi:peptidoglycan/xylan/chitin deacetylase (PgdA/CDA1 family)
MQTATKIFWKLRRESRYLGRDIRYSLSLDKSFFTNARGSRVLIYHGLCTHDHTRFNPIFLTARIFEEHLKLYKKYFNVVSMDDFYLQNFSSDKFNVCLTFDDGFANNHKYVLPLLAKYQMPATFFITGISDAGYDILWNDFLGIISKYGPKTLLYKEEHYYKGQHDKYISTLDGISLVEKLRHAGFKEKAEMMELLYPLVPFRKNRQEEDYWLQMTDTQIRQLAASPYAHIGAHGYYHNDLSKIPIGDAATEMLRCKQYLECVIDKPVNSFAFPYGAYSRPLIAEAKKAGYLQLLAMDFHWEEDHADPALRERFTVNPFISPVNQLHATITRQYER